MSFQQEYVPNLYTPPLVEIVPHDPNIRAQLSRSVGRIAVGVRGGDGYVESELNPRPLAQIVDNFDHHGGTGPILDRQSPEGHELADSFMQVPPLDKQVFIKGGFGKGSRRIVSVVTTQECPIWIPTRNIVFAPGLEDWSGKGRIKVGTSDESSERVIRRLARKGSPTAAVPDAVTYLQPDGQVLYSMLKDGGHRTAGAVVRGDKAVPVVGTILVYKLPNNVLPRDSS